MVVLKRKKKEGEIKEDCKVRENIDRANKYQIVCRRGANKHLMTK